MSAKTEYMRPHKVNTLNHGLEAFIFGMALISILMLYVIKDSF